MTEYEIEEGFSVKIREEDSSMLIMTPQGFINVRREDDKTLVKLLDHAEIEIKGSVRFKPEITIDSHGQPTVVRLKDTNNAFEFIDDRGK